MGWIDLAEVRDKWYAVVHTVMRLWVLQNEVIDELRRYGFSRKTVLHVVS